MMMTNRTKSKFEILTAAAHMPGSCWGRYGKIAVLEVDPAHTGPIKMISPRARGVRSVVKVWDRLNKGTTKRCAYARAMSEAEDLLLFLARATKASQKKALSLIQHDPLGRTVGEILEAAQRERLNDYRAVSTRLEAELDPATAYTLSRRLDALARAIRQHDPRGRTVGVIFGWDNNRGTDTRRTSAQRKELA